MPQHTCGSQKTTCGSWGRLSFHMQVLGFELRPLGLSASAFILWAILSSILPCFHLNLFLGFHTSKHTHALSLYLVFLEHQPDHIPPHWKSFLCSPGPQFFCLPHSGAHRLPRTSSLFTLTPSWPGAQISSRWLSIASIHMSGVPSSGKHPPQPLSPAETSMVSPTLCQASPL